MSDQPTPIAFSTLLTTTWPEEVLIEGGILSRGDSMLIGAESKAGKSTLLSLLIRELIKGGNFLGFTISHPLKVLYMQAELRESRLRARLEPTYCQIPQDLLATSFVWNTRGVILLERHAHLIREWLEKMHPDILVIDPLVNFHMYDENNATEMSKLFRIFDLLKLDYHLSLIFAHHFRKKERQGKSESLMEMIRGSTVLRGWVDTTIALEGRGKSEYRRLEFDTRNSDEPIQRLIRYNMKTKDFEWQNPLGTIYEMLAAKMNGQEMPTAQVIQLILTHCGTLVARNRTRAHDLKELLIRTNQLVPREDGKITYLSLST